MGEIVRPWPGFLKASLATHLAAALGAMLHPNGWRLALGAILANHVLTGVVGLWPRSALLGPNITRLPPQVGDCVALTFDDGPDPDTTPRVMDLLERYHARASFFCIGERAERRPDLVAQIVARGHEVHNHSYSHPKSFAVYGWRALTREISKTQEILAKVAGRPPTLFRAPVGLRSPWLDPVLARQDLALVSWTRRGFDTILRDPGDVASLLLRGLRHRDILLLHDGSSARGTDGEAVVLGALERILEAMKRRGFEARPLASALCRGPG